MKNYKDKETVIQQLASKTCDKCGKVVEENSMTDEIISFNHRFGYGSDLDGSEFSFDICKDCFLEKIVDIEFRRRDYY